MYERLLPLGSVVLVKNAKKRVMITGRIQARAGDDTVYDYSGCRYPEGLLAPGQLLFFNHDAIEQLFFVGFQDEEELAFRTQKLALLGELYVNEQGGISERVGSGA